MFDYPIFHTWKYNINMELFALKNVTAFSEEENKNNTLCKQNTEQTKLNQITPERSNEVDLESITKGLLSISKHQSSEYNTPQNTTKNEPIYNQKAFDSMNSMIQSDEGEDLLITMNTDNIANDCFELDFSIDSEDNEPTFPTNKTKRTLNTIDTGKKNMNYIVNNNFASENKVSEKQKQKLKKDTKLKMSAAEKPKRKTQNKYKSSKTRGTKNKKKSTK